MTKQEAVDYLEKLPIDTRIGNANKSTSSNLINMSMEALEKQIPKKPACRLTSGEFQYKVHDCPNCGEHFGFRTDVNYCEVCGQRIDWRNIDWGNEDDRED